MARTKHGVELTDDGFDEEGRPLRTGAKIPYVRGSEICIGKFNPVFLGSATADLMDRARASLSIGESTESPIELQLGAAILMQFERQGKPLKLCISFDPENPVDEIVIVPQFAWSYYRSDWAILNPSKDGALLIECDGKHFHSSPEQRAHDKKKDRAAHDRGYLTMRFAGAEIFKGADACAEKIYDAVCGE